MKIDEIKTLLRAAKDRGDGRAFLEGLRLFEQYHPYKFHEFMVEVQKLMNVPGARLQ